MARTVPKPSSSTVGYSAGFRRTIPTPELSGHMFNDAVVFIVVLIVGIFAADLIRRWWRETEWKRQWRRDEDDRE